MPTRTITPRVTLAFLTISMLSAAGCATTAETVRAAKPADLEAQKAIGAKVAGTIVWSSGRAGLPHIFSMKTDGSDVKQLTKGDFTDWHPRFSPDGKRILFARSRDEGAVPETATDGAWDLYTVGNDGRSIGKEVDDGAWGSWIANDEILFVRGSKVFRKKIGDEETEVFDAAGLASFAGAALEEPALSPKGGLLALTLGGSRFQVGIWHVKKRAWSIIGEGRHLTWTPDGASVYWVNPAGKDAVEIARVGVQHGDRVANASDETLVDLQGKRSHELFPRMSRDGKWLVFGAGRYGLDPTVDEFELYLWEVGTPPAAAVRMTFDAANDRWPDLFIEGAAGAEGEPDQAAPGESKDGKPGETPAPAESDVKKEDAGAETSAPAEKTEENSTEKAPSEEATPAAEEESAPAEPKAKGKAKAKAKGKAKKKR